MATWRLSRLGGILKMAARRYGNGDYQNDYGLTFTTDKGEVFVDISDDIIAMMFDENNITKKTKAKAVEYLQEQINSDARAEYYKRTKDDDKRKAERERTNAYKAERAKVAEQERQEKIQVLILKAK